MAIYIDANILVPWTPLSHLERVAMSIASQRLQQPIVIPAMAADEAEAHLVRRLRTSARELTRAQKEVNKMFDTPPLTERVPDIGGITADWRKSLLQLFTVRTHPPGAAEEALRREVLRLPPARATYDAKGTEESAPGARDALIWLTILEDLRERDEPGLFVTANKDFVRDGSLRPELEREVPEGRVMTGYRSAFRFLEVLGEHEAGPEVTVDDLDRRVTSTLKRLLPLTSEVPDAIFGSVSDSWTYESHIQGATPLGVRACAWSGKQRPGGSRGETSERRIRPRRGCRVHPAGARLGL